MLQTVLRSKFSKHIELGSVFLKTIKNLIPEEESFIIFNFEHHRFDTLLKRFWGHLPQGMQDGLEKEAKY